MPQGEDKRERGRVKGKRTPSQIQVLAEELVQYLKMCPEEAQRAWEDVLNWTIHNWADQKAVMAHFMDNGPTDVRVMAIVICFVRRHDDRDATRHERVLEGVLHSCHLWPKVARLAGSGYRNRFEPSQVG